MDLVIFTLIWVACTAAAVYLEIKNHEKNK
jgi:hypothetical protein